VHEPGFARGNRVPALGSLPAGLMQRLRAYPGRP
jgi:hypothetical protein